MFGKCFKMADTQKEFFVNEGKKTVVCKLSFWVNFHYPDSYGGFDSHKMRSITPENVQDYLVSFKGMAKCSDNDEFKVEIGKRIAESRAFMKAFSYYQKAIQKKYEEMQEISDKYLNAINELQNAYTHEKSHCESVINSIENV